MTAPTPIGPAAPGDRALAPDLTRGFMLLLIALANSHYFLPGFEVFGGFPLGGTTTDRAVAWTISTFVDGRAWPLFGFLFGYGIARIVARQALEAAATRRLLWRRAEILILLGAVHGLLLFVGDILAAYGVLLLVGAWAVGWKDRTLLWVAAGFFALGALPSEDSGSISLLGPDASMLPADVAQQLEYRPPVQLFVAVIGPVGFVCPYLVGLWAGRRRILEHPERHLRLLGGTAVVGLGAAVAGAQPAALIASGVREVPGSPFDESADDVLALIGPLHDATGVLGGFGYAALIALITVWLGRAGALATARPVALAVRAVAATGQRSLTCYLAQSVVWFVVFTPYVLGLAPVLSITATALLACATWLATVVLADRLRAAGNRGPFEALTRRITYGGWRALRGART